MIYSKLTSLALAFLLGLQLTVAQPHGKHFIYYVYRILFQ